MYRSVDYTKMCKVWVDNIELALLRELSQKRMVSKTPGLAIGYGGSISCLGPIIGIIKRITR